MKNNTNYIFFNILFLEVSVLVSVSAKVSAICGIGIGIGRYLSISIGIGIGGNFGIGAALLSITKKCCTRSVSNYVLLLLRNCMLIGTVVIMQTIMC